MHCSQYDAKMCLVNDGVGSKKELSTQGTVMQDRVQEASPTIHTCKGRVMGKSAEHPFPGMHVVKNWGEPFLWLGQNSKMRRTCIGQTHIASFPRDACGEELGRALSLAGSV